MNTKKCLICNNNIISTPSKLSRRKTCSLKCRNTLFRKQFKSFNNPNFKNASLKICQRCSKEYHSYNKKSKYCSHLCADISNRKNPFTTRRLEDVKRKIHLAVYRKEHNILKPRKRTRPYLCSVCKSVVVGRKTKYCKTCNFLKGKIINNCLFCKTPFISYASRPHKFCNEMCKFKYYNGSGNPNYIDGRNPENKRIRNSNEYKFWRNSVFQRDNYTCVWCGQVGGVLHADHIKSFSLFPELRLVISNGRTLCKSCHEKTPSYKNKKHRKE